MSSTYAPHSVLASLLCNLLRRLVRSSLGGPLGSPLGCSVNDDPNYRDTYVFGCIVCAPDNCDTCNRIKHLQRFSLLLIAAVVLFWPFLVGCTLVPLAAVSKAKNVIPRTALTTQQRSSPDYAGSIAGIDFYRRGGGETNHQIAAAESTASKPKDANSEGTESLATYSITAVDLPLQVLLYSLAEQAMVELVLHEPLEKKVTLRLERKPLEFVLEQLARQGEMRWKLNSGLLEVFAAGPYLQSYPVNYLNISRKTTSQVGLATQVGSINLALNSGGDSSGFSNSSQSLIENHSSHEFWESLTSGLQMILATAAGTDSLVINRDTGTVTVRAVDKHQREVAEYLEVVQRVAERQVLIEATVVEVTLSDQFQAGIDWRALANGPGGVNFAQVFHSQAQPDANNINQLSAPSALLSAVHQSSIGRITATLSLLQDFGDVRILSRPQIIAINNQSAILKVVDNRVYFTMSVERQLRDGQDDITTSTEIHTVPVGLVMSVTPYIGTDEEVILNVRPTISRILGFVNDPNPELAAAQVKNGVPEIQVREMESVLKVANGEVAMIGGLMQQQHNNERHEIPGISAIPGIGKLFQSSKKQTRKTELLVFLQPTIIDHENTGMSYARANYERAIGAQ